MSISSSRIGPDELIGPFFHRININQFWVKETINNWKNKALPPQWIINLYYSYTERWPFLKLFGTYPIFLSNFWVSQIYGTRSRYLLFCTRCGLICSISIFLSHYIFRTNIRKRIIYGGLVYYFYSFFVFYQFIHAPIPLIEPSHQWIVILL